MKLSTLKTIRQNFLKELQDANIGRKNSLAFIVNEIPKIPLVENGKRFQVLVVGGSICKKAILVKKDNELEVVKNETAKQPSFNNELVFLEFIEKNLEDNINILALNFAYPLKPIFINKKLDGILIKGSKENSFGNLVGRKIGEEIEKYVLQKNGKKIIVSLANDTICLLLSGLTKFSWDNLAAGIVGTGLNFAIFKNKNKLVNLESANFDKFPKTKETQIIDRESNNPGGWLFEKETTGAYLYKHFNIILKAKNLPFSPINSTEDLNALCSKNIPKISKIAQDLLNQSAQLVACQIAGITAFKKPHFAKASRGKQNMVFVMEGSLFWKGNNYKKIVKETVRKLVPEYKVEFVEIKQSGIMGGAKLIC
ncbi:MAG: hypothetical protein HYT07_03485 [Candidatus Levybacteria bacterium]|nr:hypothetical protein [Candidatus Levybacteria bacterium]